MNSVFNNNSVYGSYGNGMMYSNPVQKELTWTNALTPEEERALQQQPTGLSLEIPKEEMYRAKCTHRDPATKRFTLKQNEDGSHTCPKCGARFNIADNTDIGEIKRIIGGTIDILQTIKLSYIDMTPEVIQSYFVILPFLELAPQLYEAAMHTLNSVMPNMGVTGNYVSNDLFGSLYSATGSMGPVYNPYNQQQPMMAYQGGFMNQPMQPVAPAANPMQTQAFGTPAPAPMPSVAETVQASGQATAPQDGQTVQVGKKFKLD